MKQNRRSAEARAKLVENCKKVLIAIDFAPLTEDQGDYAMECLLAMSDAGIEWKMKLDIEAEDAA